MKLDFKGKVVLITGATRGIGLQVARDFYKLGAKLILTGSRPGNLESLRSGFSLLRADLFCVDFTDAVSTDRFLEQIAKYKKIDVCINCAGINRIDYIDKAKVKDWDEVMAVNLRAPFLIMREVSRTMKKKRYGRIINIASIFGVISKERRSIYSASKFGIRGLTLAVSNELAKYNILVNAVSPGFVLTDLTRKILSAKEMRVLAKQVPMGRMAKASDISAAVVFLASSLNTYITGQNIIVDGGFTNV